MNEDVSTFEGQAKVLLECCDNEEELIHWLFEQDFMIDENIGETGEPLPDAVIAQYLMDAGANNQQIDKILKVYHMED